MVQKRQSWLIIAGIILAALVALMNYHWHKIGAPASWQAPANALAFLGMMSLIISAYMYKDFEAKRWRTADLRVAVIIPVFNEDPKMFLLMLKSLDKQTRQPDYVHIIDDGSDTADCRQVFREWAQTTKIKAAYTYKENGGKREAQAVGIRKCMDADVFVTIDSDTQLDFLALENGLKPFANPKVMSVCGFLLGQNYNKNLLTRLIELGFVSSFLNGRASLSSVHRVMVNTGGLAMYRGEIVRKYLDEYLAQTVFGHKASSGDDRVMTNFAALEGWTVFQESCVGYTLHPENMKHLLKQRIRWWRSFFWGGTWLIRRFPITKAMWWMMTWQMFGFVLYTVVISSLLIRHGYDLSISTGALLVYFTGLSYIRNARYLSIKRPDQSFPDQLFTYLLSPLSSILHVLLGTVLQYAGLATVKTTKWGTRQNGVEVTA